MTVDSDTSFPKNPGWHLLSEFPLPDEPGREHQLVALIMNAVQELNLSASLLTQLRVLIDAVKASIRRERSGQPSVRIIIRVWVLEIAFPDAPQEATGTRTAIQLEGNLPLGPEKSDSPLAQGWGCFLIEGVLDAAGDPPGRKIELYLYPEGGRGSP